jgi:hypothetical protein
MSGRARHLTFAAAVICGMAVCLLPSCPAREVPDGRYVVYPAMPDAPVIVTAPSRCSFIEAQTRFGFRTACVTDEEVSIMMARIHAVRANGADASSSNLLGRCVYLPKTPLCATPEETDDALSYIDMTRIERAKLDAGERTR